MVDLRPSIDTALAAFGVSATVTLPAGLPVEVEAFWLPTASPQVPGRATTQRVEPKRTIVVPVDGLEDGLPRGTNISAPEYDGADASDWTVDSTQRVDFDHWRAVVVPAGVLE